MGGRPRGWEGREGGPAARVRGEAVHGGGVETETEHPGPALPRRHGALAPAVQLPIEWPPKPSPQDKRLSVGKPASSSPSTGLRARGPRPDPAATGKSAPLEPTHVTAGQ